MAISNRDRIGRAFEQLALGLDAFITRVVGPDIGEGKDWTLLLALKDTSTGNPPRSYDRRDPQAQLRMLTENVTGQARPGWYPFDEHLSKAEKSLASELRETRNRWAHNEPFSADDAYRGLDTVERLLRATGAAQEADEVRRIRVDLRRITAEQEDRRVVGAAAGVPAAAVVPVNGLRPWRQVLAPHPDVQTGRFHAAEFAANLHTVSTGQADDEYGDPVQFFRRTYLTDGLRDLLTRAVRRVGKDTNASPVVNLQTTFGGGKTHSMLALWHLLSGTRLHEFPQEMQELLAGTSLDEVSGRVRRVAVVGNEIEAGAVNTRDGRPGIRTLWGEIAWQLGGAEGYALLADADRTSTNPGTALRDLLRRHSPAVILIDEWVAYARQLYGSDALPGGTFDTQFTFAQTLTEAAQATPGVFLVISIPASTDAGLGGGDANRVDINDEEVGGANGRAALRALHNVVRRVADQWRPANAEESFEIVRRRLFTEPDAAGLAHINATAAAMVDFYRKHAQYFPHEVTEAGYAERIRRAYPVHPELFDRLYEDWSTLERFQRTRGVLRLMNTIVGQLWRGGDTAPLIMPGSVPLSSDAVLTEITQYLEDAFKVVIDADVDGPGCTPATVDAANPLFGKRAVAQRLARTIFIGATPTLGTPNKGVERQRLYLGTALPGDVPGNYDSALNQLADGSMYLYVSGPNLWFDTQANSTRTARDYANQLHPEDVYAEILRRLRGHRRGGDDGFAGVHVTEDSGDVPDGDEVRLVILHPRHTHHRKAADSPALRAGQRLVEQRGSGLRAHRNALVVLAGDETRMRELDAATRDFLAWQYVHDNATTALNLTPAQQRQAQQRRDREDETVRDRILTTYCWLLVPEQPAGDAPMQLREARVEGSQDNLADRAAARLRSDNVLVCQRAASLIRMDLDNVLRTVWRDGHVEVGQLWALYTTYPYLARMRSRAVLDAGILSTFNDPLHWEQQGFALADAYDQAAGTYRGLRLPGSDPAPARLADSTLVVRPDRAVEQRAREQEQAGSGGSVGDGDLGVGGGAGSGAISPAQAAGGPMVTAGRSLGGGVSQSGGAAATQVRVLRRYFGSRRLNRRNYGADFARIAEEVLQQLAAAPGVELDIRLEISATAPGGFPSDTVHIVEENTTTLKFDQSGFEQQ
ncbi:MAG: DUF499 domain-containing protein [Micromonosporaceae bacterium]|nr:DUF499 domain-containing protein [Micromonosporaceae bacterium]